MEEEELQWHRQEDGGGGEPIYFTNHQDMGLKEGEEGLGEGGMGWLEEEEEEEEERKWWLVLG